MKKLFLLLALVWASVCGAQVTINSYQHSGELPDPNHWIGGVGATSITSASDFADLSDDLSAGDIKNFQIDGNNNVSFYVDISYTFNNGSLSNDTDITYFIDGDGKALSTGAFRATTNMTHFYVPNATYFQQDFALNDCTALVRVNLESVTTSTYRYNISDAPSLEKLWLPAFTTMGDDTQGTINDLDGLRYIYMGALTSFDADQLERTLIYNTGRFPVYIRNHQNNTDNPKFFHSTSFGVSDRDAFTRITMDWDVGDAVTINGLTYNAISGTPSTEDEFDASAGGSTASSNFIAAINADTRSGTVGDLYAANDGNLGYIATDAAGSGGNAITVSFDGGNTGTSSVQWTPFQHGSDVHHSMIDSRDQWGVTLVEVDNVITVNPPTDLEVWYVDANTVQVNFTPAVANANGTETYELWIEEAEFSPANYFYWTFMDEPWIEVDVTDLNDLDTATFKVRTMDGQGQFSAFTTSVNYTQEPNSFFGGVGASYMETAAEAASRYNGVAQSEIINFKIDADDNVSFYLATNESKVASFGNNNMTWQIDSKQTSQGNAHFQSSTNSLKFIKLENMTSTYSSSGNRNFVIGADLLERVWFENLVTIGGNNNFDDAIVEKYDFRSLTTIVHNNFISNNMWGNNQEVKYFYLGALTTLDVDLLRHAHMRVPTEAPFYDFGANQTTKVFIPSSFNTGDWNASNGMSISAFNIADGDTITINGLVYTAVNGAPADNTEYDISSGIANTIATNFKNAINADTRTGTYGDISANNNDNWVALWNTSTGSSGNTAITQSAAGLGWNLTFSSFRGGTGLHPFFDFLEQVWGATIVEISAPITVDPPTALSASSITTTGFDINFTAPTANANGTEVYEIWVRKKYSFDPYEHFYYDFVSASGDSITGLTTGTTYMVKMRTMDGDMNWSVFTDEFEVTTN